jgi:hypothetical protein
VNQNEAGSDATATVAALIRPIAQRMWDGLDADLSEADEGRIADALVEAVKTGIRVGMAEVAATVTEEARKQGVDISVFPSLHDRSDDEGNN